MTFDGTDEDCAQFLIISLLQPGGVEVLRRSKKLDVLAVSFHVARQFREHQIVRVGYEQADVLEPAGVQLAEAFCVTLSGIESTPVYCT